jgi:mono/diheme cytochrome c family protein
VRVPPASIRATPPARSSVHSQEADMKVRIPLLAAMAMAIAVPALVLAQPAVKREPARTIGSVEGDALFNAYCAVCHGKDGKGAGPAAQALKMPVPDLTTMAQRSGGKFAAADVEATITGKGKAMTPAHGDIDMPIWGPIFKGMSQDQALTTLRINNLVKYIESLQAK